MELWRGPTHPVGHTHPNEPCPLDEVIELPQGGISRQVLDVLEQVLLLQLKELTVVGDEERFGPEGPDEDAQHLGGVEHLPQGPHQRPVDAHQLLRLHHVGLVQDHPDLVLVALEGSDGLGELVRDLQLVGVKEEDDEVHALGEPLQHGREVITWEGRAERENWGLLQG